MHTSAFKLDGYDGDVRVHHNGDWSGDVIITFKEKVFGSWDEQNKPLQEAKIPGALLVALALPVTQDMISEALMSFAERLPETLGIMQAAKKSEKSDRKPKRKRGRK